MAGFATDPTGDGGQYYEIGTTDGQNYYDAAQFQIPPGDIGNWVFLAGTCDGSNWNLYRNGQLVATIPLDTADGDVGPVIPIESTIIAKGIGDNGTTETEQFALDVSGGNYRFFTTHNGNKYQALASVGPDGTWQHVVGVYDSSSLPATLLLYVNGVQVSSVIAPYA